MMAGSNTAAKQPPEGKPFVKGDPRINRRGRPKTFDQLRSLAQEIAHEAAASGGKPVIVNGKTITVTEVIMRQWAQSKDPRLQQKFIEIAYGKTPDIVEVSGKDGREIPLVVLAPGMLDKLKNE